MTYNESEHIEYWYNHHKELADEVIVVDTGSTDGTLQKAERLGIKTLQYHWEHHFGRARNFTLRCCSKDWVLFLSPDFWIDKKYFNEIRELVKSDKYNAYESLTCHHFDNWLGKCGKLVDSPQIFLFRRIPEIYYTGRVHEGVKLVMGMNPKLKDTIKRTDIIRHHDSTKSIRNIDKRKYYKFLQDMDTTEIDLIKEAEPLRITAYEGEK